MHLREASLLQERYRFRAAPTHLAMGHDLAAAVEFAYTLWQIAERDEISVQVADLVFVRLAYVENENVGFGIELLFQFFHRNCGHVASRGHRRFRAADSAELLVVDQLGDRPVRAAGGAIGILAQLQFAELHAEGIDQQQSSGERIALPQNQLDGLGRLNHADEPRQNPENSAFRARRHQAGRWRLGIETAIAWSFFGRDHASLGLKTTN